MQAGAVMEHRRDFNLIRAAMHSEGSYERTFFGAPETARIPEREYERMKNENREWIES